MEKVIVYFKLTLMSVLISALISSCGKKDMLSTSLPLTKSGEVEFCLDTAYLGFEGDLLDPTVIWQNMSVYSPAYDRMVKHVSIVNNQLTWDFQNAAELNISQNIYDYVTLIWNLNNEKLKSGNYTAEIYGIYVVIKPKYGIMPLTPQFLYKGNHKGNMGVLTELVRNVSNGWLGNYIDFEHCGMEPDGWGNWSIKGEGDDGLGRPWGYIAFNACPTEPTCILNYIIGNNSYERGGTMYEMVLNHQSAPLVTVRNAEYVDYGKAY